MTGTHITLVTAYGSPVLDFTYHDRHWPGRADGKGSTLEVINTAGDYTSTRQLASQQRVRRLAGLGGQRTAADGVVDQRGAQPQRSAAVQDAIELYNPTGDAIDIGGWYLSDSSDNYDKFRIPAGTHHPGRRHTWSSTSDDFNPDPLNPGRTTSRSTAPMATTCGCCRPTPRQADCFRRPRRVRAARSGESFGRWPNGSGEPVSDAHADAGPGPRPKQRPAVGPLVISEVQLPAPSSRRRPTTWSSSRSTTPRRTAVDLTNWRLAGGIDFDFPAGTLLGLARGAGGRALRPQRRGHSWRPSAATTASAPAVQIVGGYTRHAERHRRARSQLERPDMPPPDEPTFIPHVLEDEVDYAGDLVPATTGGGQSLNRLGSRLWGNDAEQLDGRGRPAPAPCTMAAQVVGPARLLQQLGLRRQRRRRPTPRTTRPSPRTRRPCCPARRPPSPTTPATAAASTAS